MGDSDWEGTRQNSICRKIKEGRKKKKKTRTARRKRGEYGVRTYVGEGMRTKEQLIFPLFSPDELIQLCGQLCS